jgi:hypothetical protein
MEYYTILKYLQQIKKEKNNSKFIIINNSIFNLSWIIFIDNEDNYLYEIYNDVFGKITETKIRKLYYKKIETYSIFLDEIIKIILKKIL